jgi:ankyrin repeat protein
MSKSLSQFRAITILSLFLLPSCRPVLTHMTECSELIELTDDDLTSSNSNTEAKESEMIELDEDSIVQIFPGNKLPNDPTKALSSALAQKQPYLAEWLLTHQKDAHVNAKDKHGDTFLHSAAFNGYNKVAELLIEAGTDPNAKNDQNYTPLHRAAAARNSNTQQVIVTLLKAGADPNAKTSSGDTPLHIAVRNNNINAGLPLINNGARINQKNNDNKTPLKLAEELRRNEFAALLRQNGGNTRDKECEIM